MVTGQKFLVHLSQWLGLEMRGQTEEQAPVLVRSDTELHTSVRRILPNGSNSNVRYLDDQLLKLSEKFSEEVYSTFLNLMFHIDLNPKEARSHWEKMMHHHDQLRKILGSEIDFRVSSLDYLTRKVELLHNPTIVETKSYLEIRQDTVTDAMTGLFNFRHFKRMLDQEVARSQRYESPLSLLFFDIDYFKKLNDKCGHLVGDRVLRKFAEVLAHSVRSSDFPCRYGGEEFAVIAPETSKEGALLLAERIREAVEALRIPEVEEFGLRITVSGGVSAFPRDAVKMEELLAKADAALYRAKSAGRNRIASAEPGDQRRGPRYEAELKGNYSILPNRTEPIAIKNVSEGGFLMEANAPLAPGSVVYFEVKIEGTNDPIRCVGRVAYLSEVKDRNAFDVGVSILQISRNDRGRYQQYLAAQAA